jgi:methylated-DNA-[protein]-cysteine S-methyltransferase
MFEWTGIKLLDDLDLLLVASASGIRTIQFDLHPIPEWQRNDRNPLLMEAASQLRAYFAGQLHEFQLPLDVDGTGFQKRVWGQVAAIPYGETRSYLQISTALGSPGAVRAVGAANGANPVPIVVPCHRVIGAHGKLVGYGGGLAMKKRLLELEGAMALPLAL